MRMLWRYATTAARIAILKNKHTDAITIVDKMLDPFVNQRKRATYKTPKVFLQLCIVASEKVYGKLLKIDIPSALIVSHIGVEQQFCYDLSF